MKIVWPYMTVMKDPRKAAEEGLPETCCRVSKLSDCGTQRDHGCVCSNNRDKYITIKVIPL